MGIDLVRDSPLGVFTTPDNILAGIKDETTFPLMDLPIDVFRVINQYLDFRSSLRLHSVSKRFTMEFWSSMYALDLSTVWRYLTEERLLYIIETKPIKKLRFLNLAYCNRINFSSVEKLGTLPYLISINLSYWLQMTSVEWKALLQLPKLQSLVMNNVTGIPLEEICQTLTNLTRLECEESTWDNDGFVSNLTNLEILSLVHRNNVKMSDILPPLTRLRELTLGGFSDIPNLEVVKKVTSLQKLHLRSCTVTNKDVYPLLVSLPSLCDLSLNYSPISSDNEKSLTLGPVPLTPEDRCPPNLSDSISQLNYLCSLDLRSCYWLLNGEEVSIIAQSLGSKLRGLTFCIDETASDFLKQFSCLEHLDVSNSPVVIQQMVEAVSHVTSLTSLSMYNLPYLRILGISLLKALPELTHLRLDADVSSSTLRDVPSLRALTVGSFNRDEDFIEDLQNLQTLKFLKVTAMNRVNFEVLTNLSGLYRNYHWKFYDHGIKEWRTNPHCISDFPVQ